MKRFFAMGLWVCSALAVSAEMFWQGENIELGLEADGSRVFTFYAQHPLLDNYPAGGVLTLHENPDSPSLRSGDTRIDAIYALACHEAGLDAVAAIHDDGYDHGKPYALDAYQTGLKWPYVWTRDTAYSAALGLGVLDAQRMRRSLDFKTSPLKPGIEGNGGTQIVQDTGSGGSWPVSSDRVVWALGMRATIDLLPEGERKAAMASAYGTIAATLAQDENVLFDPEDGLFRGEQSFLDWREQTYPLWTKDEVASIAASKSLSTNVAFFASMKTAAQYAAALSKGEEAKAWAGKASSLRRAINRHFYDPERGEYAGLILRDGLYGVRFPQRDLLGTSLAVLEGVVPAKQAAAVLAKHPLGPFGPPVVSPQSTEVPIYHNSGVWPFVTAWWTLAGAQAGHPEVVNAGFHSVLDAAERNLSNMENLDFVTGDAHAKHNGIEGPVINSQYQVWSVAAAVGLYHRIVFGIEASLEGIRFQPKLTAAIARQLGSREVVLRGLPYLGKKIDIVLKLPELGEADAGFLTVETRTLNGQAIGDEHVAASRLQEQSEWVITLSAPQQVADLSELNRTEPEADFVVAGVRWMGGGVSVKKGRVVLQFSQPANHRTQIFRDGVRVARNVKGGRWVDPDTQAAARMHEYAIFSVDAETGLPARPPKSVRLVNIDRSEYLAATTFTAQGGELREGSHFASWGKPSDTLESPPYKAKADGEVMLRVEFANGSGPVNTGICCAVKKLEVLDARSGQALHSSYLVMPQSGTWERRDFTTPIKLRLKKGQSVKFKISEDEWSRNMSYLDHNTRYTASMGGGNEPSNLVDIFGLQLVRMQE